jgi:hypothetical protein
MNRRIRFGGSIFVVALVALMFTAGGATIERMIFVSAEDSILNYMEQIYWDEETYDQEYAKFRNDKGKYVEDLSIAHLQSWQKNSYYHVDAADWSIAFISTYEANEGSTYILSVACNVEGPQTGTKDRPYYAFEWLVKPILGTAADLYAFQYSQDERRLTYEGKKDDTSITINLVFAQPVSHCHYHVWYKK